MATLYAQINTATPRTRTQWESHFVKFRAQALLKTLDENPNSANKLTLICKAHEDTPVSNVLIAFTIADAQAQVIQLAVMKQLGIKRITNPLLHFGTFLTALLRQKLGNNTVTVTLIAYNENPQFASVTAQTYLSEHRPEFTGLTAEQEMVIYS